MFSLSNTLLSSWIRVPVLVQSYRREYRNRTTHHANLLKPIMIAPLSADETGLDAPRAPPGSAYTR